MIKILTRYIAKTIFSATVIVAFIIIGLLFLLLLLGELKNIGEGDYGLLQALSYVVLRMPNEIYQFSPMLILLGTIVGLSILTSYRELAIMRASGFAIWQMMLSIFSAAIVLIFLISVMGEVLAPNLSYKAEINKENAQNAGLAVVTASGVWLHIDNNFIHIQHVVNRELLRGITRYQFDDAHRLQVAYYAKTLAYENHAWIMKDVVQTKFYMLRTKSAAYPTLDWDLKFNPNLLNLGLVNPNEMSLSKLARFARYLQRNGLQATEYQYEFWQRALKPLASIIMIFLAIPFVLGMLHATTLGWRILVGIMLGFVFFIANAFLGQLCIVYQLPPFFAAAFPLLLFAGLGLLLSARLIRN